MDDPLRASADIMLPTPSSHGESKDSKEPKAKDNKNFYQVEIPVGSRFTGNDDFLNKLHDDRHDFTEQMGELTLRQIQIVKDKSRRLFPIYPDTVFKSFWDFVAMSFICYHAIVIPYRYCFKARAFGWLRVFEFLVDIFFIIDLCKLALCNLAYSFELCDRLLQTRKLDDETRPHHETLPSHLVPL